MCTVDKGTHPLSEVEATAVGTVSMGVESSLDHDGVRWTANKQARPCQWCCLLAGLCETLQQIGEVYIANVAAQGEVWRRERASAMAICDPF